MAIVKFYIKSVSSLNRFKCESKLGFLLELLIVKENLCIRQNFLKVLSPEKLISKDILLFYLYLQNIFHY